MTEEFQVGIIGYGGFGQYLHRAWEGQSQVMVAAVADPDQARRSAASESALLKAYSEVFDKLWH